MLFFTQSLQLLIETAGKARDTIQTKGLEHANLLVLINAILYNPAAALHILENIQANASSTFLNDWFSAINKENGLPRVHDKKLTIVALCALLELDPASVPNAVKEGWPLIVGGTLHVFKDLPKAIEGK